MKPWEEAVDSEKACLRWWSRARKAGQGFLRAVTASKLLYLAARLIHYKAENHQNGSEVTSGWKKPPWKAGDSGVWNFLRGCVYVRTCRAHTLPDFVRLTLNVYLCVFIIVCLATRLAIKPYLSWNLELNVPCKNRRLNWCSHVRRAAVLRAGSARTHTAKPESSQGPPPEIPALFQSTLFINTGAPGIQYLPPTQ